MARNFCKVPTLVKKFFFILIQGSPLAKIPIRSGPGPFWANFSDAIMSSMFSFCTKIKRLDLSSFITYNVINMEWMFSNMENLEEKKYLN